MTATDTHEYEYKLFISYRRRDGANIAQWLRQRLIQFRPPTELSTYWSPRHSRSIFIDQSYQRASSDFFEEWIVPNLNKSESLLVVVTPSLRDSLPDGSPHWVDREVDAFLDSGATIDRIIIVLGPGAAPEDIPQRLRERSPNLDWVDLRGFRSWISFDDRRDSALAKILSRIHRIPDKAIPVLNREQERRRRSSLFALFGTGLAIIGVLSAALIWALAERSIADKRSVQARRAETEALHQRDLARTNELQANTIRNSLIGNTARELHKLRDFEAELKAIRLTEPDFSDGSVRPYSASIESSAIEALWRRVSSQELFAPLDADCVTADVTKQVIYTVRGATLRVRELLQPNSTKLLDLEGTGFYFLKLSTSGKVLLALTKSGELTVIDLEATRVVSRRTGFDTTDDFRNNISVSKDDNSLLVVSKGRVSMYPVQSDGSGATYDTRTVKTGYVENPFELSKSVRAAFSPSNRFVVISYLNRVDVLHRTDLSLANAFVDRSPGARKLWAQLDKDDSRLFILTDIPPDTSPIMEASKLTSGENPALESVRAAMDILGRQKFDNITEKKSVEFPSLKILATSTLPQHTVNVSFSSSGDLAAVAGLDGFSVISAADDIVRPDPELNNGVEKGLLLSSVFQRTADGSEILVARRSMRSGTQNAAHIGAYRVGSARLQTIFSIASIRGHLFLETDGASVVEISSEVVRRWTPRQLASLRSVGPGSAVSLVATSLDGNTAVIAHDVTEITTWDVPSRRRAAQIRIPVYREAARDIVIKTSLDKLAISENGEWIAAISDSRLFVWNVASPTSPHIFSAAEVLDLKAASQSSFVVKNKDGSLDMIGWNGAAVEQRRLIAGGSCSAFAVLPNSDRIACAGAKGAISLVSSVTGDVRRLLEDVPDILVRPHISASPTGRLAIAARANGEIIKIEVEDGRARVIGTTGYQASPEGIMVILRLLNREASDAQRKRIFDRGSERLYYQIEDIVVSPTDDTFVIAGRGALQLFQVVGGANVQLGRLTSAVVQTSYSPDGRRLASLGHTGEVRVFNLTQKKPVALTEFSPAGPTGWLAAFFSRSADRLILVNRDTGISVTPIFANPRQLFDYIKSNVSEKLEASEAKAIGLEPR